MNRYLVMTMALLTLALSCGPDDGRPVFSETVRSAVSPPDAGQAVPVAPAMATAQAAAASINPCDNVDGHQYPVTFTALEINNADPKCGPPYETQGQVSQGALPMMGVHRCGCCAASYDPVVLPLPDAGTKTVCHVTSTCNVCFNGGNSDMSCDLWFDATNPNAVSGTEWSDSNGQLCPHVKVGLNLLPDGGVEQ